MGKIHFTNLKFGTFNFLRYSHRRNWKVRPIFRLKCRKYTKAILKRLNFIQGMANVKLLMFLVNISLGKSFVKNSECVKMWLTDEQATDTNLYKRRLSDGLFAIGRKDFSRHFIIKNSGEKLDFIFFERFLINFRKFKETGLWRDALSRRSIRVGKLVVFCIFIWMW